MRTQLLTIALLAAAINTTAQLAPTTLAPLRAHLNEVNTEWRSMDPAPVGGDRLVRFDNEAQRIALHLHMVRERLLTHAPEGVSATQMHARTQLLDRLGEYADRGSFPQNNVLPYRNPVFIDPHGTACAVGQLMVESGDRPLAEHISSEMNLAYVHDMHRTDVDTWAAANGFNEDELAWIQPGYPPSHSWYGLGGGTSADVTVLLHLNDGNLLVAGAFGLAGGIACEHVAIWNGTDYDPLGSGVDANAKCAVEFNGKIYLGGSFSAGYQDLAVWNGTTWSFENVFNGKYVAVNDLHVFNGELYAAGYASGFAGDTHQVMKLAGSIWTPVGSALDGSVNALEDRGGELVCAGAFTHLEIPLSPGVQHVAHFIGGDWSQLGDGLDANVYDLHRFDGGGGLFAGGELRVDSVPTFGLALLTSGASTWEPLMPNQMDYVDYFNSVCRIEAITDDGTSVFIGGAFNLNGLMTYGSNVAQWGGTPDYIDPWAEADGGVHDLVQMGNALVMGGAFMGNGGLSVPFIGYTDNIIEGIGEHSDGIAFSISPNPATDQVLIELAQASTTNTTFSVIDASGHEVMAPIPVTGRELRVDVRSLAAGHYLVQLSTPTGVRTLPFVKR